MERAWEAKELGATTIPVNSYNVMDHKPADSNSLPKTRPLCWAHRSLNGELSEWVSDLVEPTTPGIYRMCLDVDDLFIGSLDASALYPSLLVNPTAKIVGEHVRQSEVDFQGFNWIWASIFVAL